MILGEENRLDFGGRKIERVLKNRLDFWSENPLSGVGALFICTAGSSSNANRLATGDNYSATHPARCILQVLQGCRVLGGGGGG